MLSSCTLDSWSGSDLWRMALNQQSLEEAEAEAWEDLGQGHSHDLRPFNCTWVHTSQGDVFSVEQRQLWLMGSLWDHPSWSKLVCVIRGHTHTHTHTYFFKAQNIESPFVILDSVLWPSTKSMFLNIIFCLPKMFPYWSCWATDTFLKAPRQAKCTSEAGFTPVYQEGIWPSKMNSFPDKGITSHRQERMSSIPHIPLLCPPSPLFLLSPESQLPVRSDPKAQRDGGGFILSPLNTLPVHSSTQCSHIMFAH